MSDTSINQFLASGTAAEMAAHVPDPPVVASGPDSGYFWYQTDTGDTYAWDGAAWQPVGGGGTVDLATDVTGNLPFANLTPATTDSVLLGRGDSSGGDYQEIALGANLTMTGTTLAATGGGGGGDSTTTAAYASRPAASNDGNLFLPSDGFAIDRDTGAAWAPWGPLFPLTPPDDSAFSWDNQGGASVTASGGGIYLLGPLSSTTNYRVRYKTAPATPYTLTVLYLGRPTTLSSQSTGIGFMESATGKYELLRIESGGMYVTTLTNATTPSANPTGPVTWVPPGPLCYRISDDGTNLKYFVSHDGQNFFQIGASRLRGAHFTTGPNRLCFFVNEQTNVYPVAITIVSWKEA